MHGIFSHANVLSNSGYLEKKAITPNLLLRSTANEVVANPCPPGAKRKHHPGQRQKIPGTMRIFNEIIDQLHARQDLNAGRRPQSAVDRAIRKKNNAFRWVPSTYLP